MPKGSISIVDPVVFESPRGIYPTEESSQKTQLKINYRDASYVIS